MTAENVIADLLAALYITKGCQECVPPGCAACYKHSGKLEIAVKKAKDWLAGRPN